MAFCAHRFPVGSSCAQMQPGGGSEAGVSPAQACGSRYRGRYFDGGPATILGSASKEPRQERDQPGCSTGGDYSAQYK